VLRKFLFHHVADNVVVNYLLLALLAVHEAVDAGLVDEPGAPRRVTEDFLDRVIGENVRGRARVTQVVEDVGLGAGLVKVEEVTA
jgi:hypothetical protein